MRASFSHNSFFSW